MDWISASSIKIMGERELLAHHGNEIDNCLLTIQKQTLLYYLGVVISKS